jgi:hypothetical protein
MSPIITAAPAFANASAMAAPIPRAPPVTRALRPARAFPFIVYFLPLVISLLKSPLSAELQRRRRRARVTSLAEKPTG